MAAKGEIEELVQRYTGAVTEKARAERAFDEAEEALWRALEVEAAGSAVRSHAEATVLFELMVSLAKIRDHPELTKAANRLAHYLYVQKGQPLPSHWTGISGE